MFGARPMTKIAMMSGATASISRGVDVREVLVLVAGDRAEEHLLDGA